MIPQLVVVKVLIHFLLMKLAKMNQTFKKEEKSNTNQNIQPIKELLIYSSFAVIVEPNGT